MHTRKISAVGLRLVSRLVIWVPLVGSAVASAQATLGNDIWVGGAGAWNVAAKWSEGVPNTDEATGLNFDVLIDNRNATPSSVTLNIQGAGQIGAGQLILVNGGTINDNLSAGITIDASAGFTNTGLVKATSGAKPELDAMTISNAGGTIAASYLPV